MINLHHSITVFVVLQVLGTLILFLYAEKIPLETIVLEILLVVCGIFSIPAIWKSMRTINEYY